MDGLRIEDGQTIYKIGSKLDLALQLSSDDALTEGLTVSIEIRDIFNNVIDTVVADQIGGNLYVAEWTVPVNLDALYNTNLVDETDMSISIYCLQDVWIFSDASESSYSFSVSRRAEQVIQDDSLFTITISDLNNTGIEAEISFMSKLSKYYAPVDDVIAVSSIALSNINTFDLVKQIKLASDYVDNHMKPSVIVNSIAFNSAVKCFVRYTAAANALKEDLKIESESKKLDTFTVQKAYNSKGFLSDIESKADDCALVIWAGGNDTPFTTKRFQKGLCDPNRPSVSRANLDISGNAPWVNVTTGSLLSSDMDGNIIELRGVRTISLPSASQRMLL